MNNNWAPLLIVVGLGGLVIWYLTRSDAALLPPPVYRPTDMCGASYAGVGASVPCDYIAKGLKALGESARNALAPVTQELGKATQGLGVVDVAIFPVGVSHVAYNELSRLW